MDSIDYTNCKDYQDIIYSEKIRQSKDEPSNVFVCVKCKKCSKEFDKWLFDPSLKELYCSRECEMDSKLNDYFDENSSRLKHECVMCGKLFDDDSIVVGENKESGEVDRKILVCSKNCREMYRSMFGE